MHNVNPPPASELPSSRALLRSTAVAALVAGLILVCVVLPAEYAIDPTGVGGVLGLTRMGEIKMELAEEAAAAEAAEALAAQSDGLSAPAVDGRGVASPDSATAVAPAVASDTIRVELAPGQGREIKLAMKEGAEVRFEWTVDGGVVNSDTHADRPGLSYHGYAKGQSQEGDSGVLTAAFDGMHGWFWRNRSQAPVVVTLRTEGDYQEVKEVM